MLKYYNKDVNDLFEYNNKSSKVSINEIYANVYNVSNNLARKETNNYATFKGKETNTNENTSF